MKMKATHSVLCSLWSILPRRSYPTATRKRWPTKNSTRAVRKPGLTAPAAAPATLHTVATRTAPVKTSTESQQRIPMWTLGAQTTVPPATDLASSISPKAFVRAQT